MSNDRRDLLELISPLSKALRRIEERCARSAGLSMWQYAILSVASRHAGMSQAQIADHLGYSRNRIINDLDVLQERGFAERRIGNDRRRHLIHVTPQGRDTADTVRRAIWRAEDALLSPLATEARDSLQGILAQIQTGTATSIGGTPSQR